MFYWNLRQLFKPRFRWCRIQLELYRTLSSKLYLIKVLDMEESSWLIFWTKPNRINCLQIKGYNFYWTLYKIATIRSLAYVFQILRMALNFWTASLFHLQLLKLYLTQILLYWPDKLSKFVWLVRLGIPQVYYMVIKASGWQRLLPILKLKWNHKISSLQ